MITSTTVFSVRPKARFWQGVLILMLVFANVCIFMAAISGHDYPNLDPVLLFAPAPFLFCIAALVDFGPRARTITLQDGQFSVRTIGRATKTYSYDAIRGYNERSFGRDLGLTVYLKNSYFNISSFEFAEYEAVKNHFQQYGQPLPRQRVLMAYERNAFRWLLAGTALVLLLSIGFGYLAHNDNGGQPATLTKITGIVRYASIDRSKFGIKGLSVQLWQYPDFSFYLGRNAYDVPVMTLKAKFAPGIPVTVQIRESDYRKKITKTVSTTFGDRYSNYNIIPAFGIGEVNDIDFQANTPARQPRHSSPGARTVFSGFLVLCCWAGWVGLNRFTILRG